MNIVYPLIFCMLLFQNTPSADRMAEAQSFLVLRVADNLEPDDVVRLMYNTSGVYLPPFDNWSPRMKKLLTAELQWMDANTPFGPVLDGDYLRNSGGERKIRGLRISLLSKTQERAQVRATFDPAESNELVFDLVLGNGSWVVDEVRSVKGNHPSIFSATLNVCQNRAC